MAKYRIVGLPKAKDGLTVLHADPRNKANVEAEKGETIVTNTGLDNLVEQFTIGGKKHSEGGTPLNAAINSFIFSMNKKMLIKDKPLLQFFGESGNKAMMPGEIAKKYDLNSLKKTLKDPTIDKITKDSVTKSYENAMTKLSALAIVQESLKGTPQGSSNIFQPFLDKTGVEPAQLFGVAPEEANGSQLPQQALGGNLNNVDFFPKVYEFAKGGNLPMFTNGGRTEKDLSDTEKEEIKTIWNNDAAAYLEYKNTEESLRKDPKFVDDLFANYQKVIEDDNSYTSKAKGKANWQGALKSETKNKFYVLNELLNQERRNAILAANKVDIKSEDSQRAITGKNKDEFQNTNKQTIEFLNKMKEKGVDLKHDFDFSKGFVGQAAYLAFDKTMQQDDYKNKRTKEYQTGVADERGNTTISGIDNQNTNTTLGQRLNYKWKADPTATTPDAKPAESKIDLKKGDSLPDAFPQETRMDYLLPDKMNIAAAFREKAGIKKYGEYTPNPDVTFTDHAYYSPDYEVNAINAQLAQGVKGSNMFGTPQSATANFMGMQGNAFNQVAGTISRVADLNVNAYNQERDFNTQIANANAATVANNAERSHDKRVITNQAFDNAMRAASNKINQAQITAWNNRKDLFNAQEMIGEQFVIDPNTGFVTHTKKEKSLTGESAANKTEVFASTYKTVSGIMPDATADQKAKVAMMIHSGKMELTDITDPVDTKNVKADGQ
jgi:hypothetical protein